METVIHAVPIDSEIDEVLFFLELDRTGCPAVRGSFRNKVEFKASIEPGFFADDVKYPSRADMSVIGRKQIRQTNAVTYLEVVDEIMTGKVSGAFVFRSCSRHTGHEHQGKVVFMLPGWGAGLTKDEGSDHLPPGSGTVLYHYLRRASERTEAVGSAKRRKLVTANQSFSQVDEITSDDVTFESVLDPYLDGRDPETLEEHVVIPAILRLEELGGMSALGLQTLLKMRPSLGIIRDNGPPALNLCNCSQLEYEHPELRDLMEHIFLSDPSEVQYYNESVKIIIQHLRTVDYNIAQLPPPAETEAYTAFRFVERRYTRLDTNPFGMIKLEIIKPWLIHLKNMVKGWDEAEEDDDI